MTLASRIVIQIARYSLIEVILDLHPENAREALNPCKNYIYQ